MTPSCRSEWVVASPKEAHHELFLTQPQQKRELNHAFSTRNDSIQRNHYLKPPEQGDLKNAA